MDEPWVFVIVLNSASSIFAFFQLVLKLVLVGQNSVITEQRGSENKGIIFIGR